jgi:hypothetical protein
MGLLEEAVSEGVVQFDDLVNEHLEGNLSAKPYLLGEVDDAHPSPPEDGLDTEPGDLAADPRPRRSCCHAHAQGWQRSAAIAKGSTGAGGRRATTSG